MSFATGLHYPQIDIGRGSWVNSAILYWDRICTIVPDSINRPYSNRTSEILESEGILYPIRISQNSEEVQIASQEFQRYAQTPAGRAIMVRSRNSNNSLNISSLPRRGINVSGRLSPRTFGDIYWEKISDELFQMFLLERVVRKNDGGWLEVDSDIISCYMTILAGNIAHRKGVALLAKGEKYDRLAGMVRRGQIINEGNFVASQPMIEARLTRIALRVVKIDAQTPIEKIIEFRSKYIDEIARFREELGRIAKEMDNEYASLDDFYQRVEDVCKNSIVPAVNDLEKSLASSGIKNTLTDLSTFLTSTSAGPILQSALDPLINQVSPVFSAVVAGIIGVAVKNVIYRYDREESLRKNPYSFILSAKRSFGM